MHDGADRAVASEELASDRLYWDAKNVRDARNNFHVSRESAVFSCKGLRGAARSQWRAFMTAILISASSSAPPNSDPGNPAAA
jgi:hypothetical protein